MEMLAQMVRSMLQVVQTQQVAVVAQEPLAQQVVVGQEVLEVMDAPTQYRAPQ